MSNVPTLINLPPPPSDPVTPSDVPSRSGTPNSTTTSMSELSTVAIKDGHRGHLPHHSSAAPTSGLSNQLDAERADRISRLAGLERVARNPASSSTSSNTAAAFIPTSATTQNLPPSAVAAQTHGYFDATGNPALGRERSTVGSASATGSVGARTTWAGSEAGDVDKMSESQDMDMDTSSVGALSEEGGTTSSLVGFGEGARTPARQSGISNPGNLGGAVAGKGGVRDAKMIDGMTYDRNVVDTTAEAGNSGRRGVSGTMEEAERIVRENMNTTSNDRMRGGRRAGDLGKFGFEK